MLKVANSVINASQIKTPITFAGDVTLSTGNLVIGTAGKGIDFTATTSGSGTMTSELLADYEEGTWTPTFVSATGTLGAITYENVQGRYTKVGRTVSVSGGFYCSAFAVGTGSGALQISGLPFANGIGVIPGSVGDSRLFSTNNPNSAQVFGSTVFLYYKTTANGDSAALQASDAATGSGVLNLVYISATYFV